MSKIRDLGIIVRPATEIGPEGEVLQQVAYKMGDTECTVNCPSCNEGGEEEPKHRAPKSGAFSAELIAQFKQQLEDRLIA